MTSWHSTELPCHIHILVRTTPKNSAKRRICCRAPFSGISSVVCSQVGYAPLRSWADSGGTDPLVGHCKSIAKIPNLFCVSSVDTLKKAQLLNTTRTNLLSSDPSLPKLSVHVQVNTSGEEAKSGCAPGSDTVALCKEILESCPSLHLLGLMTIGAIARSKATTAETENEDFVTLKEQRDLVAKELGLGEGRLELSMGMSDDFEGAVKLGSGEVRVGSTIFGQRPAKADAKIKE